MKKLGRNEPCHCGSGKKFKKCCESKMIGGRYVATKIDSASSANKVSNLTGLFQRSVSVVSPSSEKRKPIKASKPAAPETSPPEPPISTEKVE